MYGEWVIKGVGGYYVKNKEAQYTPHNPQNPDDFNHEVVIHESGHHKEHLMGKIPPWHYSRWSHLFLRWYNIIGMRVISVSVSDLPGVEAGDVVELDFTDGGSCECIAGNDNKLRKYVC